MFGARRFGAIAIVLVIGVLVLMILAASSGWIDAVPSRSMTPAIAAGSMTFAEPVPQQSLHAGDIVVYTTTNPALHGLRIVHRIVDVTRVNGAVVGYVTIGDANRYPDTVYGLEPLGGIPPSHVLGKVVLVAPYLGLAVEFVKTLPGLLFLASVGVVLVGLNLYRSSGNRSHDRDRPSLPVIWNSRRAIRHRLLLLRSRLVLLEHVGLTPEERAAVLRRTAAECQAISSLLTRRAQTFRHFRRSRSAPLTVELR